MRWWPPVESVILFQLRLLRRKGFGQPADLGQGHRPGEAPSLRFCLSHFRPRNTTSKPIGPRLARKSFSAGARSVPRTPSSATAAAASRRMMNTTIGLGFAAASAIGAARLSPSCRPSRLLTAITVSSPAASHSCAVFKRAVPGRPRRPPSKIPIALPIPLPCADGSATWIRRNRRFPVGAGPCRPSPRGWAGLSRSSTILFRCAGTPFSCFSLGSGRYGFRNRAAHHPCLGKRLLSA